MTESADALQPEFTVRGGKRGSLALWTFVWAGTLLASAGALIAAIGRPTGDGQGGAGNLVIPSLVAAFALLALAFSLGQWWNDTTYLRAADDRVEIRHGGGRLRGRAAILTRDAPVTLHTEGGTETTHVYLEQGDVRTDLGDARLLGKQVGAVESWLRNHGMAVERRADTNQRW